MPSAGEWDKHPKNGQSKETAHLSEVKGKNIP